MFGYDDGNVQIITIGMFTRNTLRILRQIAIVAPFTYHRTASTICRTILCEMVPLLRPGPWQKKVPCEHVILPRALIDIEHNRTEIASTGDFILKKNGMKWWFRYHVRVL